MNTKLETKEETKVINFKLAKQAIRAQYNLTELSEFEVDRLLQSALNLYYSCDWEIRFYDERSYQIFAFNTIGV